MNGRAMRLRVATLNVWGLPEPISRDLAPRMEAIGDRLPGLDLDVVAFQEAWTASAPRSQLASGRRAPEGRW